MNYLKKFNESIDYNSYFTLSDEDIEDICLEMTDNGFKLKILRRWLHNGVKSKQPVTSKSTPIYEIRLEKSENDCISDRNRWDGSFFLDDIQTLRIFTSILNRIKSYGDAYYYIHNLTYTITLHLNEVEVERGFDFNIFQTEFSKWVNELLRGDENFENIDAYGGGSSYTYEFQTKLLRSKLNSVLIESDKDLDNKEMYYPLIRKIRMKLLKYSRHIDYEFTLDNQVPRKYKVTKKSGFFSKPKELCYSVYILSVSIKRKKSTF